MSQCRDCSLPIAFVRMAKTGRNLPVDGAMDPTGNVAARRVGLRLVDGYIVTPATPLLPGFLPLRAHHATCGAKRAKTKTPAKPAAKPQPDPATPALF